MMFSVSLKSVKIIISLIVVLSCLTISTSVEALPRENLFVDFKNMCFSFREDGTSFIHHRFRDDYNIITTGDWEIKQDHNDPRIYYVRKKTWKGFFWEVGTIGQHFYIKKITSDTFGASAAEGTIVPGTSVAFTIRSGEKKEKLTIEFDKACFIYNKKDGISQLVAGNVPLLDKNDLEIKRASYGVYEIRFKHEGENHFRTDPDHNTLTWMKGNHGRGIRDALVRIEQYSIPVGIFEDLGFTEENETRYPKSDWIESQKKLYQNVLKKNSFDVLVVPFQVQGYAIDRAGRSLMTRYLVNYINQSTDLEVLDSSLAARAFGPTSRAIEEEEIYRLANELKVKILIRGSVGHNRDEKMNLSLLIQEADKAGFSSNTKATRLDWKEIPFSDENLPEEVFYNLLDEVASKLPFKIVKKHASSVFKKENDIPIPETIMAMVTTRTNSPVIDAYHLQFLGALFPNDLYSINDAVAAEHLFERSLVVLATISPKSTDYDLLKARALFNLQRRPAALVALGAPHSPEEKAFLALLNGNLPEMRKWIPEIKSPLKKMIAQIELNDLRFFYKERILDEDYISITKDFPNWEPIISRRLRGQDKWYSQSNLLIKQIMDAAFPIPHYTSEDIKRTHMVMTNDILEGIDIDLSPYYHYSRFLNSNDRDYDQLTHKPSLTKWDYLDLLYAIGEANLLKDITIISDRKALHEKALEKIESYGIVYRGHPYFTCHKGIQLNNLAYEKKEKEYLHEESLKLKYNAHYWAGGQIQPSAAAIFPYYDADYPAKPYWGPILGDRNDLKDDKIFDHVKAMPNNKVSKSLLNSFKSVSLGLKYTHNVFLLSEYHRMLTMIGMQEDANSIWEQNKHRFIGNPARLQFLVKLGFDAKDNLNKIKKLEDAIAEAPDLWDSYSTLGNLYIKEGDFKKALETFLKYPLFKEGQEGDMVAMSGYAIEAAEDLYWHGAVDESIPLLEKAADSQTGSASQMMSNALLAQMDGDYYGAAEYYLQMTSRYEQEQGYRFYMMLLHALGHSQDAWSIFNTLDIQSFSPNIWTAAFVGHRKEAKTINEINQFLKQDNLRKVSSDYISRYLLSYGLIDRPVDNQLPELIEKAVQEYPKQSGYISDKYKYYLAKFVDGYYCLRKGEYEKSYDILKTKLLLSDLNEFALPYYVWSGIKANKVSEIDKFLQQEENDYYNKNDHINKMILYLSKAVYYGLQGKHKDALKHLNMSRYNVRFTANSPIYPWYQLVETCVWLYEDTKNEKYRILAVELTKLHQRIQPYFAWAYAIEAKYTKSEKDRLKALAITLYLDKNSERISKFSDTNKAEALKWLNINNPFLKVTENIITEESDTQAPLTTVQGKDLSDKNVVFRETILGNFILGEPREETQKKLGSVENVNASMYFKDGWTAWIDPVRKVLKGISYDQFGGAFGENENLIYPKTSKSITIGCKLNEVEQAYGSPDNILYGSSPFILRNSELSLIYSYENNGLWIMFVNNKPFSGTYEWHVTNILIGNQNVIHDMTYGAQAYSTKPLSQDKKNKIIADYKTKYENTNNLEIYDDYMQKLNVAIFDHIKSKGDYIVTPFMIVPKDKQKLMEFMSENNPFLKEIDAQTKKKSAEDYKITIDQLNQIIERVGKFKESILLEEFNKKNALAKRKLHSRKKNP